MLALLHAALSHLPGPQWLLCNATTEWCTAHPGQRGSALYVQSGLDEELVAEAAAVLWSRLMSRHGQAAHGREGLELHMMSKREGGKWSGTPMLWCAVGPKPSFGPAEQLSWLHGPRELVGRQRLCTHIESLLDEALQRQHSADGDPDDEAADGLGGVGTKRYYALTT